MIKDIWIQISTMTDQLHFLVRSTLCSVIAHLTEETQPSFEATLKSKAVSENSNVKFSCVVRGKHCLLHTSEQLNWNIAQRNKNNNLKKNNALYVFVLMLHFFFF